jgi:hypothetical protein
MFSQGIRVLKNGRSKEDCLFVENRVIIVNDYFGENIMHGVASATPPVEVSAERCSARAYELACTSTYII